MGLGDPFGLGTTLDEAYGAAAALAQAQPSAAAQIEQALVAALAQHGQTLPPELQLLIGAALLANLPRGMTLGQYLEEYAQYQVPTGQTYARVNTLGPNDPGSIPEDPLGPGGLGGAGGGGPGDPSGLGGGGTAPTVDTGPDQPEGTPTVAGGGGGARPDPYGE
jgi:hypothetical protein